MLIQPIKRPHSLGSTLHSTTPDPSSRAVLRAATRESKESAGSLTEADRRFGWSWRRPGGFLHDGGHGGPRSEADEPRRLRVPEETQRLYPEPARPRSSELRPQRDGHALRASFLAAIFSDASFALAIAGKYTAASASPPRRSAPRARSIASVRPASSGSWLWTQRASR